MLLVFSFTLLVTVSLSSDVVLLVFSFVHALLLWFSSAFSLSALCLDVGLNTIVSVTYNKQ